MRSPARSLAVTTMVSGVGLAASLTITALAPRVLDTTDLALLFTVVSALGVASQVGTLGLGEVLLRLAARSVDGFDRAQVLTACSAALLVAGLVATVSVGETLGTAGILLLGWVPIAGLSRLVSVLTRLDGADGMASVVGEVARRVGMVAGLLAVWALGAGWLQVALAGLAGELASLVVGWAAASRTAVGTGLRRRRGASPAAILAVWRHSGRHAVAGLPRLVVTTAGPLVLSVRLGSGGAVSIAELGMVTRLTAIGGLATLVCTRALEGWTVRAATGEVADREHRQRIRRWSLVLMGLSLVPGLLATDRGFTTLVFGEQGALISPWTAVLMGVTVAASSGAALRYQDLVVGVGPERWWAASLVVVVGWTGSAFALAEPLGAEGVAGASAAASIAFLVVLIAIGRPHLPVGGVAAAVVLAPHTVVDTASTMRKVEGPGRRHGDRSPSSWR